MRENREPCRRRVTNNPLRFGGARERFYAVFFLTEQTQRKYARAHVYTKRIQHHIDARFLCFFFFVGEHFETGAYVLCHPWPFYVTSAISAARTATATSCSADTRASRPTAPGPGRPPPDGSDRL